MHFATVIRPVVVGFAIVGQAAILPLVASAQRSSLRVQSATDGDTDAGTLRFAKPVVKNQARIVDHSVKQAAWNNTQPTSSAH